MPIDDRLRAGLATALDDAHPDMDAALTLVLVRAGHRSRVRHAAYAAGLGAAAVVAAVALSLGGGDARRSLVPAAPSGAVRVLDDARGTAVVPAPLAPGDYAIPFLGAAQDAPWAKVQVPAGWGQDRLLLATGQDLDPHLRRVELFTVTGVAPDPCAGSIAPVKPTVTDIVTALTTQRTVQPSNARPVSIDGYSGQLVQTTVPPSLDTTGCQSQALRPFGNEVGYVTVFPGWTYRTWVLDVQGHPLVIMAAHGPATTPTELTALTQLVEGITFVAPR